MDIVQQIAAQGLIPLLLTAALAYQTKRLYAAEKELRDERLQLSAELKEEREKYAQLEAQHSKVILALGSKMTEAVRFLASELRSRRR